jgi:hypothetical protein
VYVFAGGATQFVASLIKIKIKIILTAKPRILKDDFQRSIPVVYGVWCMVYGVWCIVYERNILS